MTEQTQKRTTVFTEIRGGDKSNPHTSLQGARSGFLLVEPDGSILATVFIPASTGDQKKDKALRLTVSQQLEGWVEHGDVPESALK